MSALTQQDPIGGVFRFWVELDGMLAGGFTEVSGLQTELEFEEYREGGVNGYVHRLPKASKFSPIVLKRGMTSSSELWDWYAQAMAGTIVRKSGAIILQHFSGDELCRWNFFEAYPVKWSGPELNAASSGVAIETVELVHNGLKTIFKT
ncbi:phage tail protein [Paenibacillus humicola]|uniref:phage tail protein n=1 Tax=Paenibacillus humicola TaxID=3110540 RepID=UPI00237A2ECE|nr:phage tail protein [Paenibacillus humicola]